RRDRRTVRRARGTKHQGRAAAPAAGRPRAHGRLALRLSARGAARRPVLDPAERRRNMRRLRILLPLAAALAAWTASPANAERIIATISRHRVEVTSNFTGTQIVLFGSIERDAPNQQLRGNYDIVVTVIGPRQNAVTRRKGRFLGIWTNVDSRTFVN